MPFVHSPDEVREGRGRRARAPPVARTEFPAKATHAQTRAHNAALVLRALYDLGPISRADIARLTGLTRTSVGELVADLERRRPGDRCRARPEHRRQAADPRRPERRRADRHHPRPRRAHLHRRACQPPRRDRRAREPRPRRPRWRRRRRRSSTSSSTKSEPRRPARSSASASGRRASSTSPARSAGRSASTGRTCRSPGSSRSATSFRPSSPTTAVRRPSRPTCSVGDRAPGEPGRGQGRARHRRRARPQRPAVRRRRRGGRRDRPRRRRPRRRRMPLRPVRLPRDRGQCPGAILARQRRGEPGRDWPHKAAAGDRTRH